MATLTVPRQVGKIKKILSKYYTGICTIEQRPKRRNIKTGRVEFGEPIILFSKLPCRLSHRSKNLVQVYDRNQKVQQIELFLDNVYKIPAGCHIIVEQDGVVTEYANASEPNVFSTHQEIVLTNWEDWA